MVKVRVDDGNNEQNVDKRKPRAHDVVREKINGTVHSVGRLELVGKAYNLIFMLICKVAPRKKGAPQISQSHSRGHGYVRAIFIYFIYRKIDLLRKSHCVSRLFRLFMSFINFKFIYIHG